MPALIIAAVWENYGECGAAVAPPAGRNSCVQVSHSFQDTGQLPGWIQDNFQVGYRTDSGKDTGQLPGRIQDNFQVGYRRTSSKL